MAGLINRILTWDGEQLPYRGQCPNILFPNNVTNRTKDESASHARQIRQRGKDSRVCQIKSEHSVHEFRGGRYQEVKTPQVSVMKHQERQEWYGRDDGQVRGHFLIVIKK